jgi:hypothetical protein
MPLYVQYVVCLLAELWCLFCLHLFTVHVRISFRLMTSYCKDPQHNLDKYEENMCMWILHPSLQLQSGWSVQAERKHHIQFLSQIRRWSSQQMEMRKFRTKLGGMLVIYMWNFSNRIKMLHFLVSLDKISQMFIKWWCHTHLSSLN